MVTAAIEAPFDESECAGDSFYASFRLLCLSGAGVRRALRRPVRLRFAPGLVRAWLLPTGMTVGSMRAARRRQAHFKNCNDDDVCCVVVCWVAAAAAVVCMV